MTIPSYMALAMPCDSASVEVMAWNFCPTERTEIGPFFQKKIMPVVLRERSFLSCTCQEESTDTYGSSSIEYSSVASSSERDHAVPYSLSRMQYLST